MQGSYTGMAAANFSPDAICTVSAATVGGPWLAELIVFNTLLILFAVTAIAIFDARLADRNALAARALHSVNQELLERTQRAEQAERELRESEERFRSLTDLSSDWYWEQDETLRFTRMSGGVLEETGMDPGSFIGKHRWDFPIIVDQEALAAHKAQLVAHEPFREFVYARRNKDGDLEYISASGMPLFDGDGRFLGYRGIGRNVTEQ
jgi:PAS domain S-box-containing protein